MKQDPQREADLELLRENTWGTRNQVLDYLILHDCYLRDLAAAGVRVVGWDVEAFVRATLYDDRDLLDV